MFIISVIHFCLLPAALAHEANPSVRRQHYELIYISYNEYFCANNIFTSAVKDIAWPS
jgi:hypothetical protein